MYVKEVSVVFKALVEPSIILNTKWGQNYIACIGICVYLIYLCILVYVVWLTYIWEFEPYKLQL